MKNSAAQELGKLGGKATSEAKAKSSRENAKKPRTKKWVTSIAYELEGVPQAFAFGSILARGKPPVDQEKFEEWLEKQLRKHGVGLADMEDFSFRQCATVTESI